MSGLTTFTTSRVFDLFLNQTLQQHGVDRRSFQRVNWRVMLHVVPLNEDFEPIGDSICAISSDISRGGIGFIYPEAIDYEFVRIHVADSSLSVVAKVAHNTSFGSDSLFLVGTEFVTDLRVGSNPDK